MCCFFKVVMVVMMVVVIVRPWVHVCLGGVQSGGPLVGIVCSSASQRRRGGGDWGNPKAAVLASPPRLCKEQRAERPRLGHRRMHRQSSTASWW